jgi:hypothetical protein
MDIIEKYEAEIKEDAHVDELNVKDVAMRLPAIKHKWVSRLIYHKRQVSKLSNELDNIVDLSMKKLKQMGDIQLSPKALQARITTTAEYKKIEEDREYHRSIVDYLEHVESIFRYMTNDIKNVIEIMKLEMT